MKNLTVQDWCEIIGVIIAIGTALCGIFAYLYKKYTVKPANLRANFFKSNKSWILRIYNASLDDIEASDIYVAFPYCEGFLTNWKCDEDKYPSLKKQGHFDIHVALCTSAPNTLPIRLSWHQGKKLFSTKETVQLK